MRRLGGLFASIPEAIVFSGFRLCARASDGVGLISDGVSDCVWGGRTGPTIKPKHTISQQSDKYFTTISHPKVHNLTTI